MPALGWLRRYRGSWLLADLVAGLTLAAYAIPAGVADADWSVQRGLALELARGSVGFALYAYNLGSDDSYAVVALELAP